MYICIYIYISIYVYMYIYIYIYMRSADQMRPAHVVGVSLLPWAGAARLIMTVINSSNMLIVVVNRNND